MFIVIESTQFTASVTVNLYIPATTEEESSRDTNDTSTSKNAETLDYVDLENQASWGNQNTY